MKKNFQFKCKTFSFQSCMENEIYCIKMQYFRYIFFIFILLLIIMKGIFFLFFFKQISLFTNFNKREIFSFPYNIGNIFLS